MYAWQIYTIKKGIVYNPNNPNKPNNPKNPNIYYKEGQSIFQISLQSTDVASIFIHVANM